MGEEAGSTENRSCPTTWNGFIQSRARARALQREQHALSRLISEDKAFHSCRLYPCENMNM